MPKYHVSTPKGDESYDYHLPVCAGEAVTPYEAAQFFADTFRGSTKPPEVVYVIERDTGYLWRFKIRTRSTYEVVDA